MKLSDIDAAQIARTNMVESQIRPNKVYNANLLHAMLNTPRELFLQDELKGIAYTDQALKIAPDRWLTEPLVLARLFETALENDPQTLLIVGSGSGYSAAIAAQLVETVIAVEENDALRQQSETALRTLHAANVAVKAGPLTGGWIEAAPYEAILIDGAVSQVPHALLDQLCDKGRLVAIVAMAGMAPHGIVTERIGNAFSTRMIFDGAAHVLPGFSARPVFEFA